MYTAAGGYYANARGDALAEGSLSDEGIDAHAEQVRGNASRAADGAGLKQDRMQSRAAMGACSTL